MTPLAQDTLAARRVTVVPAGPLTGAARRTWRRRRTSAAWRSAATTPGVALKRALVPHLRGRGLAVADLGTDTTDPVDYPDTAGGGRADASRGGEADAGIVIDGAGIGSAIAANKVRGVRAAMFTDETIARYCARAQRHERDDARGRRCCRAPTRRSGSWTSGSAPRCGKRATSGGCSKIRRLEERIRTQRLTVLNPQDLQRLIDIITEEVMAAQRRAARCRPCSCHACRSDCCPDRLRGVLDAGASRLGLHATGGAAGGVSTMIDHTLLKPDATRQEIEKLCREAAEFHFATVCVNPAWVATAAALLRGSGVGVCFVVGFPLGRRRRREALRDAAGDLRRRHRESTWSSTSAP